MNRCKLEKLDMKENGKISELFVILEDFAKNTRGWKIEGLKRKVMQKAWGRV